MFIGETLTREERQARRKARRAQRQSLSREERKAQAINRRKNAAERMIRRGKQSLPPTPTEAGVKTLPQKAANAVEQVRDKVEKLTDKNNAPQSRNAPPTPTQGNRTTLPPGQLKKRMRQGTLTPSPLLNIPPGLVRLDNGIDPETGLPFSMLMNAEAIPSEANIPTPTQSAAASTAPQQKAIKQEAQKKQVNNAIGLLTILSLLR